MGRKKTTEEFINDAIKVHGRKYDYSGIIYKGNKIKVKIVCLKHGEFLQTPNHHLSGRGCPKCSKIECSKNFSYNTEIFIEKAKIVHNDLYNYDKVNYIKSYLKVEIICSIHGSFLQTPKMHLKGQGCPLCAGVKDTVSFIIKAKNIHGNKFNYEKSDYKNGKTKLCITCPKHGDFWHGNPKLYKLSDVNPVNMKSFGQLYRETIKKRNDLIKNGYEVISIWESDDE